MPLTPIVRAPVTVRPWVIVFLFGHAACPFHAALRPDISDVIGRAADVLATYATVPLMYGRVYQVDRAPMRP
jgi:hypothetical protein